MSRQIISNDVYISKTLSWLLRHGAVKEKLAIDSEGYINLQEVLKHRSLNGKCNADDVKRIVDTNDKKRFALRTTSNGTLQIKAVQGHSLQVVEDLDLTPINNVTEVQDIIHGTYYRAWDSIKTKGLSRMTRNHIHFACGIPGDGSVISGMRRTCQIYIYINVSSALSAGIKFFRSPNNVILSPGDSNGYIDRKHFLKVIDANTGVIPLSVESNTNIALIIIVSVKTEEDLKTHNQGQKHKRLFEELKTRCSIYVTGFPSKTEIDSLIKAFEKIGKVVNHFTDAGRRYAIFQFADESSAEIALKSKLQINGQDLIIKPKLTKDRDLPYYSTKISDKEQERVQFLLSSTKDFNQQLMLYMNEIQPSYLVLTEKCNHLCHDLQAILSTKFPRCIAHPFGSTVTGLGFKNSDLDVYIEFASPVLPDTPAELTMISKKLLRKSQFFSKVIAIPKARTPIVKCVHVPTGISCDFNFKSKLGVFNSQLIKHILSTDITYLSVMIIIKYWAKKFEITGTGKVTNYCLVLLYLFYLQQKPHSYIPPIIKLQTPDTVRFVEGWNAGFNIDTTLMKHLGSYYKIPDLLQGFFDFYKTFDFGLWVISPLLGELIPKIDFLNPKSLPNELFYYKLRVVESNETPLRIDSTMCVQDPFVLNHNVSCFVSIKIIQSFQTLCEYSADVLASHKSDVDKILFKLFFSIPEIKHNPVFITDNVCIFKIPFNPDINFSKIDLSIKDKNSKLIRVFYDTLTQFMISVLTKVYLFEISVKKDVGLAKSIKTDNKSDVHDDNVMDVTVFHCTGKQNYWDARKGVVKEFEGTNNTDYLTVLEREIKITEHIKNVIFKSKTYDQNILDFNLSIALKKCPVEVKFEVNNLRSRSFFMTMCHSLSVAVPTWFDKYVKEINNIKTVKVNINSTTTSTNNDTKKGTVV